MVRDHERHSLLGSTYVLLASLICAYAFDRPIAIVAMAFIIVGDAMAAIVGRRFGRTKVFGKSLEGAASFSLEGPLGSGKTVLAAGICEGLGVTDPVTSPTYTLQNEYRGAGGRRQRRRRWG